jgi:hypothetical protein
MLVHVPRWVWYSCEPIFNLDEDATNRVYGIVVNLIKSSALLNHDRRESREVEVYRDEDSEETECREAIVVGPQDVANVLSCLPALLSTTHQLTPLKRHILDAVDATESVTGGDGTTVSRVQEWLSDNDIPHPSRSTLKNRMDQLDEDYYLDRYKSVAGPKGQADAYEKQENGALRPPRIENLSSVAERDEVELDEACVTVDYERPFADCHDPIRDQPFEETVAHFEAQFSGKEVTSEDATELMVEAMGSDAEQRDAMTFTGDDGADRDSPSPADGDTDTSDPHGDVSNGSQTDLAGETVSDYDFDVTGEPEGATERWVYEALSDQNGDAFAETHDVTHYVGAVDTDVTAVRADTTETVCDPTHELWQDRPDFDGERVVSESDALRELNDAYTALRQKGLVVEDESGGPPAMFVLRVAQNSPSGGT